MEYTARYHQLQDDFVNFFGNRGYALEPSVPLNSKIDPTVFVIGSCTNVFKQFLLGKPISDAGHMLVQPSVNSKYLPDITDPGIGRYASSYTNIGLLKDLWGLQDIVKDQYDFFINIVKFDPDKLSIKVNRNDADFLKVLAPYKNVQIVDDACRNKFGQCGDFLLTGRNIRFYYANNNICVLSIYVNNGTDLAIESSSTLQVLLMEKYALKNTMSVSPLNDFYVANTPIELKYYDCISCVSEMLHSNIMPNSSHMDGRTLKKYIKAVDKIHGEMNAKISDYSALIDFYIQAMYPDYGSDIKPLVQEAFAKCR